MRFILVNFRNLKGADKTACAFCCTFLNDGYVRDLTTGLVYHDVRCLDHHIEYSHVTIEDSYRKAGQ